MQLAHKNALWITSTHSQIAAINKRFKNKRLAENIPMVKVVCRHVPSKIGGLYPDKDIRDKLCGELGSRKGGRADLMVSYMNLFVGTRVRLIRNMFVEGGLYNGGMGTVWGFVYEGAGPQPDTNGKRFADMTESEREIPVVLVQMDGDEKTFPYSCNPNVPRLVPITEILSQGLLQGAYHRLQVPILPAEARTAHSVQGYTARDGVVVEPESKFFAGDYTAISRATCKEKVMLLAPLQEQYFTLQPLYREAIDSEYERLLIKFPQG